MSYMKMYFGAPGCGKSTHAARLAVRSLRKGIKVYSNFPIKGTYQLDIGEIGVKHFENCLMIIDEAGIAYNNRDYKEFPKAALRFFKMHRHYKVSCVFYSQGWDDCDKKIRTLCQAWYNMKKLGPITFIREFCKRVDVDKETHQIIDEYFKTGFFKGGLHFIFRLPYYKYFDSWDAPKLKLSEDLLWYESEKNA